MSQKLIWGTILAPTVVDTHEKSELGSVWAGPWVEFAMVLCAGLNKWEKEQSQKKSKRTMLIICLFPIWYFAYIHIKCAIYVELGFFFKYNVDF